jgi:hypothetical protein
LSVGYPAAAMTLSAPCWDALAQAKSPPAAAGHFTGSHESALEAVALVPRAVERTDPTPSRNG